MHRLVCLALALLAFTLSTPAAFAQYTKDKAAQKKIDESINVHYLAMDFTQAEKVLLGTLQACADKCSPEVRAKAWMYVGLIRGSGKNDQTGAAEAFTQAKGLDPKVKLDEALATPETKATFQQSKSQAAAAAPAPAPAGAPAPAAAPAGAPAPAPAAPAAAPATPGGTGMRCTPVAREVQTRRPIPFSCSTAKPATAGVLFFVELGGANWQQVPMKQAGNEFQGAVPCTATQAVGTLQVYIEAQDAKGAVVDSYGDELTPAEFVISEATTAPPPALPGQQPPARCGDDPCADAPPDFPGCEKQGTKEWGDSCASNDECKTGFCASGSCDYCGEDSDCGSGGTCSEGGECSGGTTKKKKQPFKGKFQRFHVGLQAGMDLALMSGKDVCSRTSQANDGWNCFYKENYPAIAPNGQPFGPAAGKQYLYDPEPLRGGNDLKGGFAPATARILVALDYALSQKFSVGGRVGVAFRGGPKGTSSFMPLHFEARMRYWPLPLPGTGIKPFVHLGGGLGQVDARMDVALYDCNQGRYVVDPAGNPVPGYGDGSEWSAANYQSCAMGQLSPNPAVPGFVPVAMITLDAWKRMGQLFANVGGGADYFFTEMFGVELALNGKLMLPTTGLVVEPSLGGVVRF